MGSFPDGNDTPKDEIRDLPARRQIPGYQASITPCHMIDPRPMVTGFARDPARTMVRGLAGRHRRDEFNLVGRAETGWERPPDSLMY